VPASLTLTIIDNDGTLSLTKTVDVPDTAPGQRATYRLVVRNATSIERSVSLADVLPVTLSPAGSVTLTPAGSATIGSLPLLLGNQPIAPGAALTVTLPLTIAFGLPAGTLIQNTALLTSTTSQTTSQSAVSFTVRDAAPLAQTDSVTGCADPQRPLRIA